MRFACCVVAVCGVTCGAGAALVDVRIVERTGQMVADAADPQLDFAVQVRVNSSTRALASPTFPIRLFGESQSHGQLSFGRISRRDDRTYTPEVGGPAPAFESGLAAQYRWQADLNSAFNGLINASGGSWTQTPDQDIGLIGGRSIGERLLGTPGLDTDGDGHPDTAAPGATRVNMPEDIQRDYFAKQNWIDVYRFRYRVTDLTPRSLDVRIFEDPLVLTFDLFNGEIFFANGVWTMRFETIQRSEISIVNWTGMVVPAPSGAAMILLGMASGVRRRRY